MDEQMQEVMTALTDLRQEVEKKSVDHDKVARINEFLDGVEEKVIQPLQAQQQAAQTFETTQAELKTELSELKEKLKAAGSSESEYKKRIDALELEIAHGRAKQDPDYKQSAEYKALQAFCVRGLDHMDMETKQLLRTDSMTEGGYLVPVEMDMAITKKITEIDPIRSVARVRTTSGKTLDLPIRDTIPVAAYEGEAETGVDDTSTYQKETITPFAQTVTIPATMDMLMDAAFDMESEIASDAGEAFAFGEGQNFVTGDGHKKPHGFVANAALQAAARDTAASGVLDPNAIILLTGDLKVGYDPVYVLNRRTLALIRTFRGDAASPGDQAGQYLWQPGLNGPVAATLNGFPYILANSMPDVAAGAFAMAFGDFRRGYTIVDRTGMSVIRDEVTQKRRRIVEFTFSRWNTAQVTLQEPIKLLRVQP